MDTTTYAAAHLVRRPPTLDTALPYISELGAFRSLPIIDTRRGRVIQFAIMLILNVDRATRNRAPHIEVALDDAADMITTDVLFETRRGPVMDARARLHFMLVYGVRAQLPGFTPFAEPARLPLDDDARITLFAVLPPDTRTELERVLREVEAADREYVAVVGLFDFYAPDTDSRHPVAEYACTEATRDIAFLPSSLATKVLRNGWRQKPCVAPSDDYDVLGPNLLDLYADLLNYLATAAALVGTDDDAAIDVPAHLVDAARFMPLGRLIPDALRATIVAPGDETRTTILHVAIRAAAGASHALVERIIANMTTGHVSPAHVRRVLAAPPRGYYPLGEAIRLRLLAITRILLDAGADPSRGKHLGAARHSINALIVLFDHNHYVAGADTDLALLLLTRSADDGTPIPAPLVARWLAASTDSRVHALLRARLHSSQT